MKKEIMIAGFGGQGVMAIGKSLVEAGMGEGREVSWVPSYGPEMRGGVPPTVRLSSPMNPLVPRLSTRRQS